MLKGSALHQVNPTVAAIARTVVDRRPDRGLCCGDSPECSLRTHSKPPADLPTRSAARSAQTCRRSDPDSRSFLTLILERSGILV